MLCTWTFRVGLPGFEPGPLRPEQSLEKRVLATEDVAKHCSSSCGFQASTLSATLPPDTFRGQFAMPPKLHLVNIGIAIYQADRPLARVRLQPIRHVECSR